MTYNTALKLITSIKSNFNGDVNYSYDLSNVKRYKLILLTNEGTKRHLIFKLKKELKRVISVTFLCEDFRINFPLIKDVESFKFGINDFTMMLSYGIKSENISPDGNLDVEF